MKRNQALLIILCVVLVLSIFSFFQAKNSISSKFKEFLGLSKIQQSPSQTSEIATAEFTNIQDRKTISINEHVISSPRIVANCPIESVTALVDGVETRADIYIFDDSGKTVLINPPLFPGAWPEGQHTIEASIRCSDRRAARASITFTVEHEEPAPEGEAFKFTIPEGGGENLESACSLKVTPLIPYFSASQGGMSEEEKELFFTDEMVPYAQALLSYAIQATGPFSPMSIELGDTEFLPQPPSYPDRFNENGLARLYYPNGSYYGVAYNSENLVNLYVYLAGLKASQFSDTIPVFLVDSGVSTAGNWPLDNYLLAFFVSDYGFIVIDVNPAQHFQDFIYQGPSTKYDMTPEIIKIALTHELGHSMTLGHYRVTGAANLMFPVANDNLGPSFTADQSCLVRRQCHNLDLMGVPYAVYPTTQAGEYICGNGKLEANEASSLSEECEKPYFSTTTTGNTLGDDYKHFHINCEEDNPMVFYQSIEWYGLHNVPEWCYQQSPFIEGVEGQCKVEEFCGNGLFEPDKEECETSADCVAQGLGTFCLPADNSMNINVHCRCVPSEEDPTPSPPHPDIPLPPPPPASTPGPSAVPASGCVAAGYQCDIDSQCPASEECIACMCKERCGNNRIDSGDKYSEQCDPPGEYNGWTFIICPPPPESDGSIWWYYSERCDASCNLQSLPPPECPPGPRPPDN